ncbi:unnamed protein product [Rotaria socialis]|uniref:BAI1-associated protein 3 n=1 Tax=Rotaria socialis TaxID=392032 RepID=A0A820PQD6_9BILA|nr:unnamed protein product [Rotaria socialis]CAF3390443.1 unnamed protein product [Rotaria socialis]CAF4409631.1 unnamed protein product [Rotaria socialis]CAF4461392.1 unnamed protein product [Rotaria socialis]CAF4583165.1 unnamed protein product [Rotaria socialis]
MTTLPQQESKFSAALSKRFENEAVYSFLENFEAVAQKHERRRQKIKKDEDIQNEKLPAEYRNIFTVKPKKISSKEYELLYIETLYTIKHKIGSTTSKYIQGENDLYIYAQEAFELSNEDHHRLFDKANEEKPPILILNVEIIEAKDLEAKDANGFSDPYCMLGIVPEIRHSIILQQPNGGGVSSDEEGANANLVHDNKLGFMKRLKSFRKSTNRRSQGREKTISTTSSSSQSSASLKDKLPAKYIQATDVKTATLNPIWMEKFRFRIESEKSETFHLDIWDHDDEFSVFEAATKLNQVQGFKGLNRYFKQIAQSARTNYLTEGSHVDDFLGSINLKISEIPSTGIDKWFSLEGRNESSKVRGQIHIRANLTTREDRGISEEDNWTDIKEHVELLEIFIDHELKQFKGETTQWTGELSRGAETILHQHAIQGGITDIQHSMCRWIAYSQKYSEHILTYKLLLSITEQLEQTWKSKSLSRDESDMLREAFTVFINDCFKQLARIRELFPAANKASMERLEQLLTILAKLHGMEVFRYCCPFQNSLQYELTSMMKTSTIEWFDRMATQITKPRLRSDEDTLRNAIELVYLMVGDAHSSIKYYNPIFESTVKMSFYNITFKKIDEKLMDIIIKALEEELGDQIHQCPSKFLEVKEPDSVDVLAFASGAEQISLCLFELYLSLHELSKYKIYVNETDRANLKISQYHGYFGAAVKKWLSVARNKILHRIERSVENDKYETVLTATSNVKFTASSLDVSNCFSQIAQFWRRLAWPDMISSITYLIKITEDMANAARLYATLVEAKLNTRKICEANDVACFTQEVSLAVNDIERIRESFKTLPIELSYDKLLVAAEKFHPIAVVGEYRKKIETTVACCSQEIIERIYQILSKLATMMEVELKQYTFHIIEAPELVLLQDTVQPLITFIDVRVLSCKDLLIRQNFTRLLELVWAIVMDQFLSEVEQTLNPRTNSSYARLMKALDSLVDYFHSDEQNLAKEVLKTEKYKLLRKLIKYYSMDTHSLIKLYYQEKLQEQERSSIINQSSSTSDLGKLYCRAYYHLKEETLYVEIISCKNLKPCDSNGLSDPYVEIQLCPKFLYPHIEKQQTSIIKKSLNPSFNEKFEFRLTEKECTLSSGFIHFIVMDHDLMWSNDFEGEAFLEISKLPGIPNDSTNDSRLLDELKKVELTLTHPKVLRSRIVDILEVRASDRTAMEFVRQRREAESQ